MTTADEIEALADSWVAHFASGENAGGTSPWAFDTLYDLCFTAPDVAWAVTEAILARDLTPHLKSIVAGGPIEGLLAQHGAQVIERIESRARTDAQFKALLGGVWKNRMSDAIWHRVKAVAGPPF